MIEKPCRCGSSKKSFKINIGPFFVGDCCLKSGFDEFGNPTTMSETQSFEEPKQPEPTKTEEAPKTPQAPKKLKDMNVAALKEMAKSKGIEISETMTKKQILEALSK
jgi:hypothetical protein